MGVEAGIVGSWTVCTALTCGCWCRFDRINLGWSEGFSGEFELLSRIGC